MKNKIIYSLLFLYAASTFISVAAMSIGYGILLVTTALLFTAQEFKTHLKRPLVRRYLSLTFFLILISLVSITRQKLAPFEVFGKIPDVLYWAENKKFFYLFNPILLSFILLKLGRSSVSTFIRFHFISMIGIGILGIIQFFSGHPHSDPTPEIFSHFRTYQTTIGLGLTHSVTSNLSMAVFPLIAAILLKPDFLKTLFESKTLQSRWFWSCVAISIIFVISMVFARSAWLTLPIGFAFLLLMGLSKKRALIAITAVVGLAILVFQLPAIRDRMNSQTGHEDRIAIWMGNIELFKTNPLFGVGWRQSSKLVDGAARYYYSSRGENLPTVFFPGHAHSVYLEMLSTTGALGLLMFLVWSAFVFVTAWRARNDFDYGWWVKGFLAALTVIYLNGIIQVNFWDSKVLHQIMLQCGILLALCIRQRQLD